MKKLLVITLIMMLCLSGCSLNNLETGNLMRPPKATGEMAEIQSLIEKTVGSDIIFKYPQNGDYRSAIIMHDIDGDEQDEAVAVYQLTQQDTQTYIMIIDKIDDNWKVIKTITSQNTDLDKVCFGDIDGSGQDDIILGWSSYTNYGKELTVILCNYGSYDVLDSDETYSDMIVNDFDDDGKAEVLTLSLSKRENVNSTSNLDRTAKARLLKFNNEDLKFELMGGTFIDSTVIRYNNVKFGNIDESQKGAVIDAITGKEKTTTEIVYWDNIGKRLTAPFYKAQTFSSDAFLRDSVIQSNDVNKDGIIELPKMELVQDDENENNVYVLSWFKYNTKTRKSEYVESIIMNDNDSYIFEIPNKWKSSDQGKYKIRLGYDDDSRTMVVCEQIEASGQLVKGQAILSISVFSKGDYEEMANKDNFIVLSQESNKVYAATILSKNTELSLQPIEIQDNFKVI